jgi:hypothetical protein
VPYKDPEARKARRRAPSFKRKKQTRSKRTREKFRQVILEAYGSRCACCGTDYQHHLTIDHVNGGGRAHREQFGSTGFLRDIIASEFSNDYQILCHNCNFAKRILGRCTCSDE